MSINEIGNEVPAGGAVPDPTDTAWAVGVPMQIFDRDQIDSTASPSPYGNPQVKRIIPGTLEITGMIEDTDYEVDYVNGTITFLNPALDPAITGAPVDMTFDWVRRNELPNANGAIQREVEPGVVMQINVTADNAFGTETEMDAFSSVISLMQGLWTSEQGEIEASLTNLDSSFQRVLSQQATVGAWTNRMETTADRNDENIIVTTDLQSQIEDLDFAKAISDFTLADAIYQASLQSAASVLNKSLMDFM
jgi:flagellin-like hook-associated protein FlgL